MDDSKKRKREKPNKKWTEDDIFKILNYLQAAPEIETPTAQIFYKKFIEMSGIDATWELIRWKVRHLKSSFKKANDWRKSTGAGLLETDAGISSVEGKVLQMCPYFKQLNEIFGEKVGNAHFEVMDSGDVAIMDETTYFVDDVETMYGAEVTLSPPENHSNNQKSDSPSPVQLSQIFSEQQSPPSTVPKKAKDFAEKMRKSVPKSSAGHLAAFQAERTEMLKIKIEWEKERHNKELALQDRKLALEEAKIKADIENKKRELELKALELEKEERLKVLEMQKDERIHKFEIEMKHKCQLRK